MLALLPGCGDGSGAPPATTSQSQAAQEQPPRSTSTATQTATQKSPPAAKPVLSASTRSSFADLVASLGTRDAGISLQGLRAGGVQSAGTVADPYAWSSIKPVIVATLLQDVGGPAGLSEAQKSAGHAAITASDNDAAMTLFQDLAARRGGTAGAAAAMTETLRRAGDTETNVSTVGRDGFSPYGQTLWPPRQQVRFMSALARRCLISPSSTAYLLGLMNEVQADQRWGFGQLASVTAFKGG